MSKLHDSASVFGKGGISLPAGNSFSCLLRTILHYGLGEDCVCNGALSMESFSSEVIDVISCELVTF